LEALGHEVVILPDATVEKPYGWIFHYELKEYLEGKTRHPMIGNCPLLVEKSGKIVLFPTSLSLRESIRRYEAGLPLVPSRKNAKTSTWPDKSRAFGHSHS
jgi:hypothetical protein